MSAAARFGARVKELREACGWTVSSLAARTALSRSYLYQVERGQSIPTLDAAEKIAGAFSLPLAAFLLSCDTNNQDAALRAQALTDAVTASQAVTLALCQFDDALDKLRWSERLRSRHDHSSTLQVLPEPPDL